MLQHSKFRGSSRFWATLRTKGFFEALMCRAVAVGRIETMCVSAKAIARELNSITPTFVREHFSRVEKRATYPLASKIGTHVHAFNLTAPSASVLEVLEYEYLTDTHYLTVKLGHHDVAAASSRLFNRDPVRIDLIGMFRLGPGCTADDDVDRVANVSILNRSDE